MKLIDYLKAHDFAGYEKIHISPHVPLKQLNNAIEAYNTRVEPKEVVILIDDTSFSSGKDGVLVCEDRLIVREMFSSARTYEYDAIDAIRCEGRRIYINEREAFKLNIPGKDELQTLFELLNQWISHQNPETQDHALRDSTSSDSSLTLGEFLHEKSRRVISDRVYVHPHIPQKKLHSAITAYGKNLSPDEVIMLVDDTAFGSAKDGILITKKSIFIKILTESLRVYDWNSIESIGIKKNSIYINEAISGKLVQTAENDLGTFFSQINKYISQSRAAHKFQVADQAREPEAGLIFDLDAVTPVEPQLADKVMTSQENSPLPEPGSDLSIAQDEATAIATIVEAEVSANHPEGEMSTQVANALPMTTKESKAKDKLLTYISTTIEQNKSRIIPILKEKTGEASLAALRDDSNTERLATFIYAFLPSLVRLALKEEVFIQFMLDNRDKILDKLIQNEALKDISGTYLLPPPHVHSPDPLTDGEHVMHMLRLVLDSLEKDRQDHPEAEHNYRLAIDNLTALIDKLPHLNEHSQDDIEHQIAFMLSFMYGFAYHKIPEDLQGESVREAYLSALLETLERYEHVGGRNLKDTEGEAIDSLAFRLSGAIPKEKLQPIVKITIDAHRALNRHGKLSTDDIVFLLKSANSFSSQWINKVLLKKELEDSELARKLDDLFD